MSTGDVLGLTILGIELLCIVLAIKYNWGAKIYYFFKKEDSDD